MAKKAAVLVMLALMASLIATPMALADKHGPAGKSNVAHLYLYEKDPETWEIVEGGAWGKMMYRQAGPRFAFNFNGHKLDPELEYTLIYYPDPWPGEGLACLGSGVVNEEGDLHIKAAADTGDLPIEGDQNYEDGAKLWLVLSDDVDCDGQMMVGWNPTEYLFEYEMITFDGPDPEETSEPTNM